MKIYHCYKQANRWLQNNFAGVLLGGIVLVGGVWYFGQAPDHYYRQEIGMNQSYQAESLSAPRMMMAKMGSMVADIVRPPIAEADFAPEETDRKIIKNAAMELELFEVEETRTKIKDQIEAVGAYVTSENAWEQRVGVLAYDLEIRVPANRLESLLQDLGKTGLVKSHSSNEQDITAQYADTANQIQNLKIRRTRLRELLQFKTDSLSDVLQVDRELTNVQNEIDRLTRTQKKRDDHVAYSQLRLSLRAEPKIGDTNHSKWNVGHSWKRSVNALISDLQTLADRGISVLVYTPIWLPVLLVLGGIWRWRKRKKRKA